MLSPWSLRLATVAAGERKSIAMSPPRLKRRLKLLQGEKDLAVVIAGVILRLDVDGPHEPAVLTRGEV